MVGTRLTIDDKQFNKSIKSMFARISNKDIVLKDIGQEMYNNTLERFKNEVDPKGNKWKPLAESTITSQKTTKYQQLAAGSVIGGRKILQGLGMRGGLLGSINVQTDGDSVAIGTNKLYAAIHQFGGKTAPHVIRPKNKKALKFGNTIVKSVNHPGSDIPARPFLGVSDKDKKYIEMVVKKMFVGG